VQTIRIRIEDSVYPLDALVYVPDRIQNNEGVNASGMPEDIALAGWKINLEDFNVSGEVHDYLTNFGAENPQYVSADALRRG
jgi:hypothetical protein